MFAYCIAWWIGGRTGDIHQDDKNKTFLSDAISAIGQHCRVINKNKLLN